MDELVVRTEVYADPQAVYELLLDFPRYSRYSEYLKTAERLDGDGGPGSRYALHFSWWKLGYTAYSEVTEVDPPRRIDWRVTRHIDAAGCWRIDPVTEESPAADADGNHPEADADPNPPDVQDADPDPPDDEDAETETCEVTFEVRFDPSSASSDAVDLPRLVSFDWVLKKAIPLIKEEAERVVKRAVADLEGSERPVELDVRVDSTRI